MILKTNLNVALMPSTLLKIREDDLTHPAVIDLLEQHITQMFEITPPESVHALTVEDLKTPDVTFWTIWQDDIVMGCGALRELSPTHGEIKSMHTLKTARGQGVGTAMVLHLLDEAKRRGYQRVSLETGSMPVFAAARSLYRRHGFVSCGPFGSYEDDPNLAFMTRVI